MPPRIARPTDPYLEYCLAEAQVEAYLIDGDHVGILRRGRRSGETWITALGEDDRRVLALIDALSEGRTIDGIHVFDMVYERLPARLRIPDPGHWSIWLLDPADLPAGLAATVADAHDIDRDDPRIDSLLAHSDSAYLFAGDPKVSRWVGVELEGSLVAVGGESVLPGQPESAVPHLVSICTHPDVRGRHLGRAVVGRLASDALARGAPAVYLEMYAGNAPAAALYRGLGFRERGRYRSGFLPGRGEIVPAH